MQQSLFPNIETPEKKAQSKVNLGGLNKAQHEAVITTEGPVLVIAGAGSGKTRTLVHRVAHLINIGTPPEQILLLTFTRKAAQEMLSRASQLLDDTCNDVVGGTFHAVASSVLRRYGHHLGYTPQFTILDRSDAEGIVNLLKSSLELSGEGKRFPSKRVVVNILSQVVNKQLDLVDIMDSRYGHLSEFTQDIQMISHHYAKFKLEHNLMDYDDLLINFHKILMIPEVASEICERFSYVMVDEYQDTNHIQAEIVRLISHTHKNIMIVGDDSQSIYSFRGADFKNIIDFPDIYKGTKVITLEENYRSTQPILTLTNAIIKNASEKYTKNLFTSVEGGKKPLVYAAKNESDQAAFVSKTINKLIKQGTSPDRIAVLFRSGFHSYKLELELVSQQIAFEKRGGLKLTESAHIKDVVSHLRVIFNPQDNLAWNRILLLIDKVGPKTAQKILSFLKNSDDPISAIKQYPAGTSWKKGLSDLADILVSIRSLPSPVAQFELVMNYYQPLFERIYHDDYPNRSRDLDQLKEIITGYDNLAGFINDTALDPPETENNQDTNNQAGNLVLSTVHSAKGLEWDTVFVINLVEGKFPSGLTKFTDEIEEERRLLYVAATRAEKRLYLVYPRETAAKGHFSEPSVISRFLEEIPSGLAEYPMAVQTRGASFHKQENVIRKKMLGSNDLTAKRVNHPFFGMGTVKKMSGKRTVIVYFDRHGEKPINLDYVKMEILE